MNLGLLLFIVCFSGAIATVSHEIDWLLNPALRAPRSALPDDPPWERWYQAVRTAHPDAVVDSLTAPPAAGWAASATISYGATDERRVYLHPTTAAVQGTFSQFNVARFFRLFHKQLYIYPGRLPHGVYVVGPLGLALLASVATALGFYRLRWADTLLRRRAVHPRTFWSSLHRASGVWTVGFSTLFAVTGAWYVYERVAIDLDLVAADGEVGLDRPSTAAEPGVERLDLDVSVALALDAFPALEVSTIFFARGVPSRLTLVGQGEAWLVRDAANRVAVDPSSGQVIGMRDALRLPIGVRLGHTMDPLHFGDFAGPGVKLVWGAAGLLLSASILIGMRIWLLRVGALRSAPRGAAVSARALAGTGAVLALTVAACVANIRTSIRHAPVTNPVVVSDPVLGAGQPSPPLGLETSATLVPPYVWVVVGAFALVTVLVSLWWLRMLLAGRSGGDQASNS